MIAKRDSAVSFELTESTLAELREIVEATAGLPGDATVRVRTEMIANVHGARVSVLRVIEQHRKPGRA